MLIKCWANFADGGPTFKQHWVTVSWLSVSAAVSHCEAQCPLATNLITKTLLPIKMVSRLVSVQLGGCDGFFMGEPTLHTLFTKLPKIICFASL